MAQSAAAFCGQPELDLGAFQPGSRPLAFFSTPDGHYFIDIFGDHVYEIRLFDAEGLACWRASYRRRDCPETVGALAGSLGEAVDFLQGKAAELGGAL